MPFPCSSLFSIFVLSVILSPLYAYSDNATRAPLYVPPAQPSPSPLYVPPQNGHSGSHNDVTSSSGGGSSHHHHRPTYIPPPHVPSYVPPHDSPEFPSIIGTTFVIGVVFAFIIVLQRSDLWKFRQS